MTKRTPGPWTAYEYDGNWFIGCDAHDSGPIASIKGWPRDDEANACLIAAAPEMLDAARPIAARALEYMRRYDSEDNHWDDDDPIEIPLSELRALCAAIAKAEGRADD